MNENELFDVKEGDEVVVVRPSYGKGGPTIKEGCKVVSVKRLYFYVEDGHATWAGPSKFARASGKEFCGPNEIGHYRATAYTPATWAVKQRRDAADERVKPWRYSHSDHLWRKLSTDQLERIADILEESNE